MGTDKLNKLVNTQAINRLEAAQKKQVESVKLPLIADYLDELVLEEQKAAQASGLEEGADDSASEEEGEEEEEESDDEAVFELDEDGDDLYDLPSRNSAIE